MKSLQCLLGNGETFLSNHTRRYMIFLLRVLLEASDFESKNDIHFSRLHDNHAYAPAFSDPTIATMHHGW